MELREIPAILFSEFADLDKQEDASFRLVKKTVAPLKEGNGAVCLVRYDDNTYFEIRSSVERAKKTDYTQSPPYIEVCPNNAGVLAIPGDRSFGVQVCVGTYLMNNSPTGSAFLIQIQARALELFKQVEAEQV